jgi:hypothetical protein
MSDGPLGQQAMTVQESQLGGRRLAGTFIAGMCFEYFTFTSFLGMVSSLSFLYDPSASSSLQQIRTLPGEQL